MRQEELIEEVDAAIASVTGGSLSNRRIVSLVGRLVNETSAAVARAQERGEAEQAAELCRTAHSLLSEAAGVVDAESGETFAVASTYWAMRAQYLEGAATSGTRHRASKFRAFPKRRKAKRKRTMAEKFLDSDATPAVKRSSAVEVPTVQISTTADQHRGITARKNSSFARGETSGLIKGITVKAEPGKLPEFPGQFQLGETSTSWRVRGLRAFEDSQKRSLNELSPRDIISRGDV